MAVGTVKFFSDLKGYGFIEQEDGPDVFVHFSVIQQEARGRRNLDEGDKVEFESQSTPKGVQAVTVRKI